MKAIILAAGRGSRLHKYTTDLPKGMLEFNGKTLLEHQINTLRSCGVTDISIVRGYQAEKIDFEHITYFDNPDFPTTNMVESLFCAEEKLEGDVIICYSDILYQKNVLQKMLASHAAVTVAVDMQWRDYWKLRYGSDTKDTESLVLDENMRILELGEEDPVPEKLHGRYVGLIRFSAEGIVYARKLYHELKQKHSSKPWPREKPFEQAYMTDFLQAIIDSGQSIQAAPIEHGWLEFDTNEDYEIMSTAQKKGTLEKLFDFEL